MVDGLAGCTACVDTPCGWHSTCARQWQCRENRRAVGSTPSSVHWAWKGCLCWFVVILLGVFVSVCVCHVGVRPRLGCCSSAFGWQQCVMYVSAARPHTCKHGSMHLSCRDYGRQGGWCTRYWWLVHVVLVCNWAVSRGRKTLKVFRPQACAAVSVGVMKVLDW